MFKSRTLQFIITIQSLSYGNYRSIEKACLQISVDEKCKDLLQFLWFKNLLNKHQVQLCKYHFTGVIFGVNCSQFLLNPKLKIMLE